MSYLGDFDYQTTAEPPIEESRNLLPFEVLCWKLRRDEIDSCSVPVDFDLCEYYDDSFAFLLAGSLIRNRSLKEMEIVLTRGLTEEGTRALTSAISTTALENIIILVDRTFDPPEAELVQLFYLEAMKKVKEISFRFHVNNTEAEHIAKALQDKQRYHHLQTLEMNVRHINGNGAHLLYKGIQRSSISTLSLTDAPPPMIRDLFLKGVAQSPSLRRLHVTNEHGEDHMTSTVRWHFMASPVQHDDDNDDDQSEAGQLTAFPKSQLEELALSHCPLKDDDVALIARAMQGNSNLKTLILNVNEIGDHGIIHLTQCWKNPDDSKLEELQLQHNSFGVAGLQILLKSLCRRPSLKTLDLVGNETIGEQYPDEIKDFIENGRNHSFQLDCLDLSGCALLEYHMEFLCPGVFENSKIKQLLLDTNRLTYGAISAIISGLDRHGFQVEEMDLQDNHFETSSVCALIEGLSRHSCVKTVHLENNPDMGHRSLAMFAEALAKTKLVCLNTPFFGADVHDEYFDRENDDESDDAGDKTDAQKQQEYCDTACRALVQAVKSNLYLEDLSLVQMEIPESVKDEIEFYLQLNKLGRRQLQEMKFQLEPSLWSILLAKCCNDPSLTFWILNEQPTLILHCQKNITGTKRRQTHDSESTLDDGKRRIAIDEDLRE